MIFLPDPVNRDHPLNRGRVAWWLTLPGLDGGRQWFDLIGKYPGTLAHMESGSGWAGTTRLGGQGHLRFDGSDDEVSFPPGMMAPLTGPFEISLWIHPTSFGSYKTIFSTGGGLGDPASLAFFINSATDGYIYLGSAANALTFSTAWTTGEWQECRLSYDGATYRIYRNGVQVVANAVGSPTRDYSSATFSIGKAASGGSAFSGLIDDLSVRALAPSADEIVEYYRLSRLGYPGVLNRIGPSVFVMSSAAPVYHSSCDLTKQAQIAVSATANVPIYGGACAVNKQGVLSGAATNLVPVYHADSLVSKSASFQSSSSSSIPNYSGTCFVSKSPLFSSSASLNSGNQYISISSNEVSIFDPVNRDHSLNYGRVAWWLSLPTLEGGRLWYDIMGRYHGTLVGADWHATARLGGSGQISTNGSSTYVDCGTPSGLNGATQAVLGVWIYKGSAGETAGCGGAGGTAVLGPRFSFIWFTDGNIYFSAETNGATSFGYFTQGDSGWHRIVGVFDGTGGTDAERLRIYSDGVPQALTLLGPFPSSLGTVGPIAAGQDSSDRFCGGSYDDLSVWIGRTFSDKDVLADYELSRLGYPDILNRDRFDIFSVAPNSYGANVNVSKQGVLSGAATHTVPVYHASGILSKSAVFSGSSTFVVPNYPGASSVSKNCALSALATSIVPTYHSNTDVIKDPQFSSGATNVAPGFDTTCFVSKAAQFSCSSTINNPVIHGGCALSKSSQFSATGSSAAPVYHANADINKKSSFSSGATTQAPIFAGSSSLSKLAQFSSDVTLTVPVYHAAAAVTKSPQISSAFSPQYHAACALTVPHIENSSANFSITAKVAVLAISKHPTAYGVGSLTIPPHAAIAVSKRAIFMGHAVNSNPNPDRPFYYVRRRHYIKRTFFR